MNCQIKSSLLIVMLISSIALTACVIVPAPAHRYFVGGVVTVAPPPIRREVIGVAPGRGYVWIDGYWSWDGYRHSWNAGRWEAPRPGYRWAPHHWYHQRDGWHLEEGHWARR